MRVNALTGVLAQQSLDGTVTPAVFTPDRRWSPDAPGLRVLTDLLATLGASKVITRRVADRSGRRPPPTAGTADYPEQAQAQELSAGLPGSHRAATGPMSPACGRPSQSTPQTSDPNLVLDPLDVALDAAASTAFRIDPAVGEANLATVEATSAGLRSGVEISSAGNSYTLASSTSPLVLTVQNNLPYDVPVRVQISGGERVGLTVSDPEIQVVPAGRSQQVKIPAEVSRSGQFQVRRPAGRRRRRRLGAAGAAVRRVHRLRGADGHHHHRGRRSPGADGRAADRAAAPRQTRHRTAGLPQPRASRGRRTTGRQPTRSDGPAGRHSAARQSDRPPQTGDPPSRSARTAS